MHSAPLSYISCDLRQHNNHTSNNRVSIDLGGVLELLNGWVHQRRRVPTPADTGLLRYWSFNRGVPQQPPRSFFETRGAPYAYQRGQPWYWPWLTTANQVASRGIPPRAPRGVVVHRGENRR